MDDQPVTLDCTDSGKVIVTLPSGHTEELSPDDAELLAIGLMNITKDGC